MSKHKTEEQKRKERRLKMEAIVSANQTLFLFEELVKIGAVIHKDKHEMKKIIKRLERFYLKFIEIDETIPDGVIEPYLNTMQDYVKFVATRKIITLGDCLHRWQKDYEIIEKEVLEKIK